MLASPRIPVQYQHPKNTLVLGWVHFQLPLPFSFPLFIHPHNFISAAHSVNVRKKGWREGGKVRKKGGRRMEGGRERWRKERKRKGKREGGKEMYGPSLSI